MRFSLLLADVDNTLFDFHAAERAAFSAVSARLMLPADEETYCVYQRINQRHWERFRRGETTAATLRLERFADFADAAGLQNADIQAMSDLFVHTLSLQQIPMEGAKAFLARVSRHMPVCLITNGFSAVQSPRISRSPLRRFIKDLLISEEFENAKPHPEMIHEAMRRMSVSDKQRVVMIGDNEDADILAAVNAGVPSILFTGGNTPPEKTNATFTAVTLKDAADWILR